MAEILAALTRTTRDVYEEHRRAGHPIVVWQDDRVVWIPPDEIPRL